jgi:hypothetical protein
LTREQSWNAPADDFGSGQCVPLRYDSEPEVEMQSFETVAQVSDDHTLTVVIPPEFPTGQVRVMLIPIPDEAPYIRGVEAGIPYTRGKLPPTSLAEWAEQNAEHWGDRIRSDDVESFTGRRY